METMSATTTGSEQSEVRLLGRSIAPGLGMGQAWVVGDLLNWNDPPTRIGPNDVDGELVRLAHSYEETLIELMIWEKSRLVVLCKPALPAILASLRRISACPRVMRRVADQMRKLTQFAGVEV